MVQSVGCRFSEKWFNIPHAILEKSLRLKQQSNRQCNKLLDCDILNFHTSLPLSVNMNLPKIEGERPSARFPSSADNAEEL